MTVKLVGNFFSSGYASTYTAGDLYISSTGWHVSDATGNVPGSSHSVYDTFTSPTWRIRRGCKS